MLKKLTIMLILSLLLSACGGDQYEGDFSYAVKDFTFTNQDGNEISKADLEGKFWIANMIFTNCNTICPPMTANMARLQNLLKSEGIDAELVSFSVDPTNDTPEILKEYIEKRGGSFDNWHAFTGYSNDEIKRFAEDSFKAFVEHPENSDQVIHVKTFYLVSPEGNAIKGYNGEKAENMQKIVEDIKAMN